MAGKVVTLAKTQGLFNKRTCMDCKERLNINNFPVLSYVCRHYPKICHMCLLDRINHHLDAANRTPLPCPYPNCTECLTPTAITRMPYTKKLMFDYMVAVTPSRDASTTCSQSHQPAAATTTTTTAGNNAAVGTHLATQRGEGNGGGTRQQQTSTSDVTTSTATSTTTRRGTAMTCTAATVVAQ